jgi:hypothetical protein
MDFNMQFTHYYILLFEKTKCHLLVEEGEKHATVIGECPSMDTLVLRWEVYRYENEYSLAHLRERVFIFKNKNLEATHWCKVCDLG